MVFLAPLCPTLIKALVYFSDGDYTHHLLLRNIIIDKPRPQGDLLQVGFLVASGPQLELLAS